MSGKDVFTVFVNTRYTLKERKCKVIETIHYKSSIYCCLLFEKKFEDIRTFFNEYRFKIWKHNNKIIQIDFL